MKLLLPIVVVLAAFGLSGCMTASTSSAGGLSGVTVPDTNVSAIIDAANDVFANAGYSTGPVNYPDSISYDKPAGAFGEAMWGGYDQTTTYRATLRMIPLSGSDYRLAVSVAAVNDAGQAGFEDSRKLIAPWSAEFIPLLNQIKSRASGAGAGY